MTYRGSVFEPSFETKTARTRLSVPPGILLPFSPIRFSLHLSRLPYECAPRVEQFEGPGDVGNLLHVCRFTVDEQCEAAVVPPGS